MRLSIINRASEYSPFTTSFGLVRSLLAMCTLLTLTFNDIELIIKKSIKLDYYSINYLNLFYIFSDNLVMGKIISIVILIVVILGFLPQVTAIFHWWVAFSYNLGGEVNNGGDMIASSLTLLIIPLCLLDPRINHWNKKKAQSESVNIISYCVIQIIKLQIAYIYFDSVISKLNVFEWVNGTSLWYYGLDSALGFFDSAILKFLISIPIIGVFLTWYVLFIEFLLSISIFHKDETKFKYLLFVNGVLIHLGIAYFIGLISFFFTMVAALILLTLPLNNTITKNFHKIKRNVIFWKN